MSTAVALRSVEIKQPTKNLFEVENFNSIFCNATY